MFYFVYTRIKGSRKHVPAHQFTGNNIEHTSHFLERSNHEFQIRGVGSKYEYDVPTKTGLTTVTSDEWIVLNAGGDLEVFTPIAFAALFKHVGKQKDI